MFPKKDEQGQDMLDFDGYKVFYLEQFQRVNNVIELNLEEKNNLLLKHDAKFYDPAWKQ